MNQKVQKGYPRAKESFQDTQAKKTDKKAPKWVSEKKTAVNEKVIDAVNKGKRKTRETSQNIENEKIDYKANGFPKNPAKVSNNKSNFTSLKQKGNTTIDREERRTEERNTGYKKVSDKVRQPGKNFEGPSYKKTSDTGNRNSERVANRNIDQKTNRTGKQQAIRAADTCPYRRDCGGCRIHEKEYKDHLAEKQKYVKELIGEYCSVGQIVGMEDPTHYRNKVHVVFDRDRRGNAISGVYEEGSHRVVPIERCLIHNQKADEIIASIRGLLKSFKIKTYDEDTGYGLLRHVLIRTGYHSNEIMVVLVIGSPIFPSKNNFVKAIRQLHPEISTIVVNVNGKNTSMILGDKEQILYGKGYIEDTLCEKVFRISPKSFYQVNPTQTEQLYRLGMDMAGLTGKETVLDAYCGIGTIGLIAADKAAKVIGVELNKDAVEDARVNAKRNNVSNIQFYLKDAGEFMEQLAEQQENIDVVFMDPPRAGSDEKFLGSLVPLKPKKVVYISCNPVTLKRDLEYLAKKGYKVEKAVPVDMFPWTNHVETIIKMTKCGL